MCATATCTYVKDLSISTTSAGWENLTFYALYLYTYIYR